MSVLRDALAVAVCVGLLCYAVWAIRRVGW